MAHTLLSLITRLRLWKDDSGQDMIEYGLMAASLCLVYVALTPNVAVSISTIFSKVATNLSAASATS